MKLYLLVEGKRTERKLYPAWLSYLVPELKHLESFGEVAAHGFFLFSAEGYPSILHQHLTNAVKDIRKSGDYDYLVVCLDAEECSCVDREHEVERAISDQGLDLGNTKLKVVVQNRCIETWFLGHRKVVSRTPQGEKLAEYLQFYNVIERDPESMGLHPEFVLHAPFHASYLKEVFRERGISYSKRNPGHVCDQSYVQELVARTKEFNSDLRTLRDFFGFCEAISRRIDSTEIPA